jgi:hypothetical protein
MSLLLEEIIPRKIDLPLPVLGSGVGRYHGGVGSPVRPGQSGEAYEVLSQDSGRAVGYIRPRICTFVEE